jgi:type VI secretion system protein ImpH
MAQAPWSLRLLSGLRRIDATTPTSRAWAPRGGRPTNRAPGPGRRDDLRAGPAAVLPPTAGRPPRIEVRFFGLFGPNGPLPLHLTEYARDRALHNADPTLVRFADIFHHRLLLLFYRAWAQAQPVVGLRPAGRRPLRRHRRLADRRGHGRRCAARPDAPDEVKLHFAGLLTRQVRNADGLPTCCRVTWAGGARRAVRRPLDAPAAGRAQPPRAVLGGKRNTSAQLGSGAVLGSMRVGPPAWHPAAHRARWTAEAFESLLPDGKALPAVMALVTSTSATNSTGTWCSATWPTRSNPAARPPRLGWTSWIGKPPTTPRLPAAPGARTGHEGLARKASAGLRRATGSIPFTAPIA